MKYLIWSMIFIKVLTLSANDAVYFTSGSNIYPTIETNISIEKEILNFDVKDRDVFVSVYFEFNNPDSIEKELLVGFEIPRSAGDASGETLNNPQIKDFITMFEGEIVSYIPMFKICDTCKLVDFDTFNIKQNDIYIENFVYLFKINFKSGINIVKHSYNHQLNSNVINSRNFSYILKSGLSWEAGIIKDFEVNINYCCNRFFYIEDVFGKNAIWKVVGSGYVTNLYADIYEKRCRLIRTISGSLRINIKNFKPKNNIDVGLYNNDSFIIEVIDNEKLKWNVLYSSQYLHPQLQHEPLNIYDINFLINFVYAEKNYKFKDKKILNRFKEFEWYIPDPNLKMEDIEFTEREEQFINNLLNLKKELEQESDN